MPEKKEIEDKIKRLTYRLQKGDLSAHALHYQIVTLLVGYLKSRVEFTLKTTVTPINSATTTFQPMIQYQPIEFYHVIKSHPPAFYIQTLYLHEESRVIKRWSYLHHYHDLATSTTAELNHTISTEIVRNPKLARGCRDKALTEARIELIFSLLCKLPRITEQDETTDLLARFKTVISQAKKDNADLNEKNKEAHHTHQSGFRFFGHGSFFQSNSDRVLEDALKAVTWHEQGYTIIKKEIDALKRSITPDSGFEMVEFMPRS